MPTAEIPTFYYYAYSIGLCVYLLRTQCCKSYSHMCIFVTGTCSLLIVIIILTIIKTFQMP
jgi:hypothetical protein